MLWQHGFSQPSQQINVQHRLLVQNEKHIVKWSFLQPTNKTVNCGNRNQNTVQLLSNAILRLVCESGCIYANIIPKQPLYQFANCARLTTSRITLQDTVWWRNNLADCFILCFVQRFNTNLLGITQDSKVLEPLAIISLVFTNLNVCVHTSCLVAHHIF